MYNNFYNPYNVYTQQRTEVVRVNGKNGADTYQLAPNSSILLLDESAPIVWLKTTDGAGYPTLTPYKIEPYVEETINTNALFQSLDERISKLEEALSNGKSNVTSTRKKSTTTE